LIRLEDGDCPIEMKKKYLIIAFIVIGLYAMLNPKLWRNSDTLLTRPNIKTVVAPKNILPLKTGNSSTNCCPMEDSLILGTWILVDDTLSKWVFTIDKMCYTYYADTLSDVDTHKYRITNETTLCGYNMSAGSPDNKYLEWTNPNNPNDKMCFVIGGLSDEVLNVTPFGSGEFLIFKRPGSNFDPYN